MKFVIGKKKEAHWEIDEHLIRVYSKPQIVFGKLKLEHQIYLDNIESIEIYFTSLPMGGAANRVGVFSYAHQVMFNIKIKNEKNAIFNILTGTNRNELIQAINYLKNKNITFIDQYNLIALINDKNKKIWDGVEQIIKENNLPYVNHKV